ncbi:hypothetical protein [Hymenobacter volaticus]|uniref:Uncharacterized protein n=1 Tax=Hymenobacter volaticus TaxID=2932254 RepID=A0ABY4G747_9BACT|nr:hypothetical protein [Hymenobacter volaticus]UOQ66696.1 hypothetical protein MUN86_01840 [Hymenobacter volaticus]
MKVVEYERSLQWIGHLHCPACQQNNLAWRSSGMSEAFPHFYCSLCSNVILQRKAQELVYYEATPELLARIAATLPACPCGGHFTPTAGPKCHWCHHEIPIVRDPVAHLQNPNMVVLNGACVFPDEREPYQVRIVD